MKKQLIIIGITLLFILVGFCGCTEQNSSSDSLPSDQSKSKAIPPTTESIQTILSKTETIESMYYEIDASIDMSNFGTQTALIKIWQKSPYLKEQITSITDGITTSISVIHRPEGTYIYDDEQDSYILTMEDVTSLSSSLQYFDSDLIKTYLNNETLNNYDTEIIDGKKATVLQYAPVQENNLIAIKMWIWNERGVPLKAIIDMTMEDMTMTMDFTFSNYSFSDISDNTFNLSL